MRQFMVIALLSILALGSFLLMRNLEKTLEVTSEDTVAKEIATAHNVIGRFFGVDNQLKYQINSQTVSEFSHTGGTNITKPLVSVFDDNKQLSWKGSANMARLSTNKDTLILDGSVQLIESPNTSDRILVNSEHMVYHADKESIIGDKPVVITSNNIKQSAQRFQFDVKGKTISFKESIKAHYGGDEKRILKH